MAALAYGERLNAFQISTFLEVKNDEEIRDLVFFYEYPIRRFEQWRSQRNRVFVSARAVMNGIRYYFKHQEDQYRAMIKDLWPSLNKFQAESRLSFILDSLLFRAVRQYAMSFFHRESIRGVAEWITELPVDEVIGQQHYVQMRDWVTDVQLAQNFLGDEMVESKSSIDRACVLATVEDARVAFEEVWPALVAQRRARGLIQHDDHVNAAPAAASLRKRQKAKPKPKPKKTKAKTKTKPKRTAKSQKRTGSP